MWMKHKDHQGLADLPDLPFWRAQGWEPTDGPPLEPDLLHDPPPIEAPEAPEAPEDTSGASSFQPTDQPTSNDEEEVTRG